LKQLLTADNCYDQKLINLLKIQAMQIIYAFFAGSVIVSLAMTLLWATLLW
jgi:hypothetical protein